MLMNEQANVNDGAGPAYGVTYRRVLWPVAVGAVSIALAASKLLTVIGSILGLGFQIVLGGGSSFDWIFSSNLWGMVAGSTYFLGGIMGCLLLPAGLLVWRQSRLGPGMHKAYAILAIILNLAAPIAQLLAYPESYRMQLFIWPIWRATIEMVYPVFLLIWFARAKVKAETRLWR